MVNESTSRVPSTKELLNPTLEVAHALGGSASIAEITNQVIDLLVLPPDVVNAPHGDGRRTELEYRLGWARTYLKTYGLIANSGRGVWSLTSSGSDTHHVDPDEVMRTVLQLNKEARQQTVGEDGSTAETHAATSRGIVSESTIGDLKVAIRRLEAEKRQIDEQIRGLATALRYFDNTEGTVEPPMKLRSSPTPTQRRFESADRRPEPQHRRTDSDLRSAMVDILAGEGPLHRQVIHGRLVEMGVRIGGRDPINNVSAHLSIDPRFRSVGSGVWELNDPETAHGRDRLGQEGTNAISGDASEGIGTDHDQQDSDEEDRVPW